MTNLVGALFVDTGQRRSVTDTAFILEWTTSLDSQLSDFNCGIRHVTVPTVTRILIANVRHIGVSNICVINLVYFKMQV